MKTIRTAKTVTTIRTFLYCLVLFFGIFGIAKSSLAADYNVSTSAEFKAALINASPGDNIILANGTYIDTTDYGSNWNNWHMKFSPTNSGREGLPITIKALNRGGAIIRKNLDYACAIGNNEKNYIIYDGLKIEGMIILMGGNHCVIKNCEVTVGSWQMTSDGPDYSLNWGIAIHQTDISSPSEYNTIQNNYVHNIDDVAADVDGHGHLHNSAGIMVFGDSDHNTIENNSVDCAYPNGSPGNLGAAYGTKGGLMDDCTWKKNFGINCLSGFVAMGDTNDTVHTMRGDIYQNIIVNTAIFFLGDHGGDGWTVHNNTFYTGSSIFNYGDGHACHTFLYGGAYQDSAEMHTKNITSYNNIMYGGSWGIGRGAYSDAAWSNFITYSDFNNFYNTTRWSVYATDMLGGSCSLSGGTYTSLGNWQSGTTFDHNSKTTVDPGFINAGGITPESYKRNSYINDGGRGGLYPSVMGAYITGTETIGYTADSQSEDTTAPDAPVGLSVI